MTVTIAGTTGITQPTDTCTTSLVLTGSSSGTTTVQAAATASGTITVPAGTGTVAVNGLSSNIVSGTVTASTSGTAIPFTGIPSWVKRITMMLNGVSTGTTGTSPFIIQLGTSGGYVTSGYTGSASGTGGFSTNATGFWIMNVPAAASVCSGLVTIALLDATNNIWAESGAVGDATSTSTAITTSGWSVALSGALTQIQLTTVAGNAANTFDAGKVSILYE